MAAQILGEVPIPDTGDLRRDLTTFAAALAASLNRVRVADRPGGGSAGLATDLAAAAARHADIGDLVRAQFGQRHALARPGCSATEPAVAKIDCFFQAHL